jgi:hypothetical protein
VLRTFAEDGFDTRVTVAYGAQSALDCSTAVDITSCLGIEPLMITDTEGNVNHNILHPLAKEGRLPAFLAEHLEL